VISVLKDRRLNSGKHTWFACFFWRLAKTHPAAERLAQRCGYRKEDRAGEVVSAPAARDEPRMLSRICGRHGRRYSGRYSAKIRSCRGLAFLQRPCRPAARFILVR